MSNRRHSLEAEQSVLGALLIDNRAFDAVGDLLRADDFARQDHARIWTAIATQIVAGKPADPVTVQAAMRGDDESLAYLFALSQAVPSSSTAKRYAELVRECSLLRQLDAALSRAHEISHEDGSPMEKLDAIGALVSAIECGTGTRPRLLAELIPGRMDSINEVAEGSKQPGWPTKFPTLNWSAHGGLRPGQLVIVAARPSVGKSSLSLDLCLSMARDGFRTAFFSQEMSAEELADRAIANASEIPGERIALAQLSDMDWKHLTDGVEGLAGVPLWIDDTPALKLSDIRAKARSIKGLQVLVVDYLQLCSSSQARDTRTAQIGEISRGLKALAKEMGIVVVALSQLNRDCEKRKGGRPMLADLRDSGEIEQDADAVWLLWTLRNMKDGSPVDVGLDVAKQRGGRTTEMVLSFNGAIQKWRESPAKVADFNKQERGGDL